jgi:hypothetical protein
VAGNLQTIGQLAKRHLFTETQIRWWVKNAASNGLAPAIQRVGARVLIDEDQLTGWLERQTRRRQGGDA